VIAEAGVNHDGDPEVALELVRAAARAGADAVKFQTFQPRDLVAQGAPKAAYQERTTGSGESQLAMLERLVLPESALVRLCEEADRLGLLFLSTPFDAESARLLLQLGVPAFKVGSGDATHLPFLRELAGHGRPLLVSTGMCTLEEVEALVEAVRAGGDPPLALLHCVSAYPAPGEQANLRAMQALRRIHHGPVGYSDHTLGSEAALAAVALGASILEKHLTLDRRRPGPDHAASAEPDELAGLIAAVRRVEAALGDGVKRPAPCEADVRLVARRSIVAARPLAAGTSLTPEDLACKRPGTGLPPRLLPCLMGRRLRVALGADQPLAWEHVD
jgi:sialic acid synthase SpsE